MSVQGRKVLVTGASSGIGAALARELDGRVARLGIVGRDEQRLQATADACSRSEIVQWAIDLGDLEATERLADEAWDTLGGVDVLVNNAAMPKRRHVLALSDAEIDEVMRVNFHSPVRLARRLLPRMIDCGRGLVINVSSFGGRAGIINESAYSASKFALTGWSESAEQNRPLQSRLRVSEGVSRSCATRWVSRSPGSLSRRPKGNTTKPISGRIQRAGKLSTTFCNAIWVLWM